MPAIRDVSWNTTTAATGTTLVISTPAYAQNDLLLAIITADTGTATWSSSGWTVLFTQTNTCQQAMLYKIAGASEASSFTFTASAAESFNGCIISIQDIDTANPFGNPVIRTTSTQAAAAKFAMPTVTTNVANSLLIYASSNSGLGVPSLLEGPVYGLIGADGVAESMGVGWGFQAAVGTTSASVTCSNVATGAGIKTCLQIAPPTGGATIIPTYCAADNSVYIDPLNGTTAYNGNTAFAATADTNFGTSLGGLTAADGTVAATADVGINSFHSAARITSISGSQNLSGAELVFATANRPNVTGKNVLFHVGPSTEGQLQRFSSIASGRGIWAGFRSGTATDYKIWQVYGVELGALRQQPVVINPSAGNTKASAGTLNPAAVFAIGFWVSGTGVTTTAWDFLSVWALDTTTICGGNSTYPVDIRGIVEASSMGKERRSTLKQGLNQMLCLQPLQFGNGGTNPIYLDLNATAVEFPKQYDAAAKAVTYNSIDNVAGLTYYAGASDTIYHRNSVVSSASKYHWRIHASSSASATYDFGGLSIIGAGDVVLRDVTTFDSLSFDNCGTIQQNSAYIANCNITGAPGTALLSNNPGRISDCYFEFGTAGYAIEINTPGTYSFSGNIFSGYGANGSATAAIYNNSGGTVTLNVSGVTPTYTNGSGATTVINNSITLTLTGLVSGSDIVILDAGTSTERINIDSNASTTYNYNFSTGGNVDICVYKKGYIPFTIRNYTLSASNGSVPINQVADRNYVD